jgi:signal transduction histidine kinase
VASLGEDKARGATQREIVEKTLRDGHWHGQVVNFAEGGREVILDCRTQLVCDHDGKATAVCGVSTDITERVRLEAQLRQQQKLEAIGTLAGGVAHEINNPINGIMNYAQLIKDLVAGQEPAVDEIADEIIIETERVASIVRNLLRFARHEKEEHGPVAVREIVEGTLALVNTVLRHDQILLEVSVPEGLPQIRCRSQEIQQVVMNLVTNARDALNAKYLEYDEDKVMRLQAARVDTEHGPCVKLTVEDHGIGIEPDVKPRIFDPFFTTKGRDQGTGLGLSISYGIVREHGGTITVETETGKYSRVSVFLPVAGPESVDAGAAP